MRFFESTFEIRIGRLTIKCETYDRLFCDRKNKLVLSAVVAEKYHDKQW